MVIQRDRNTFYYLWHESIYSKNHWLVVCFDESAGEIKKRIIGINQ